MKSKCLLILLFICCFPGSFYFTQAQGWKKLPAQGAISARANSSAVIDTVHHRMIVFGGNTAAGNVNDLWTLDLENDQWSAVAVKPSPAPSPRFTHNALFDASQQIMYIWSGQGESLFNDVWAFDFADSSWILLSPNGNEADRPLTRYGTAATYDTKTRSFISFAGFTNSGRFQDTWQFQTEERVWKNIEGISPPRRCLHQACMNEATRSMYIFGGQDASNLNDVWRFDLDLQQWEEMRVSQKPPARHFSTLVCNDTAMYLFGGNASSQGNYNGALEDLWQYSFRDNRWDSLAQGSARPSARMGHTAVFDPDKNRMIIFSGNTMDGSFTQDVWSYTIPSPTVDGVEKTPAGLKEVSTYPNPFNLSLYVTIHHPMTDQDAFSLYNAQGKLLIRSLPVMEQSTGPLHFDTQHLPPGLYLSVTELNGKTYQHVLIKE